MDELRPIIVFHGRHFVRHLGICDPICVKFLRVMSGVIPSNFKKNDVSDFHVDSGQLVAFVVGLSI